MNWCLALLFCNSIAVLTGILMMRLPVELELEDAEDGEAAFEQSTDWLLKLLRLSSFSLVLSPSILADFGAPQQLQRN